MKRGFWRLRFRLRPSRKGIELDIGIEPSLVVRLIGWMWIETC